MNRHAEKNTPPDHTPGGVFSSNLARAAKHAAEHLAASKQAPEDAAELWGKRIGRSLSAVAVIALAWLFGHQASWW